MEIFFCGDVPNISTDGYPISLYDGKVFYPEGNSTWTEEAMSKLSKNATFVPYTPAEGTALNSGIAVCAAPDKPSVDIDAVFRGEYGSGEQDGVTVKTADFDGLLPGAEYVLLVLASADNEDRLAADNLLYIGHAAAAEDGTASFTYIPRTVVERSIIVLCGPSSKDLNDAVITFPDMTADGELQAVEPTVVYDGVTLIEGEDYEITGTVSFLEKGTYTCYIQGIRSYTGLVECVYTVAASIHDHVFEEYVSDGNATCTADGTKTATCIHCELTDTIPDEGSALGHSWDEGVVTVEPTTEYEGEIVYTCYRCGETRTEYLPQLHEHSFYYYDEVAPTCYSEGYTIYKCSQCDELSYDDYVPMIDHTWDEGVVTVEPTVETEGEMLYTCTVCGATRTEAIPKVHVHSFVAMRQVAPTCTDEGYTLYMCFDCGEAKFDDYVAATGHSFGEWTVVREPGATEAGLEEHTCGTCGFREERAIPPLNNPFTDVAEGSFYYKPVMWAVANKITSGLTSTTFGPTVTCNRAQVVTFLWRAAGSPEPKTTDNPFVDVKKGSFYYKAVLWAVEENVTNGLDATHFGPLSSCNRAQVVTFLYRSLKSPPVKSDSNPFTDVPDGKWYTTPVLWAVENKVTSGLTAGTFGPTTVCNRAQIVTFLYRAFAK